MSDQAQLEKLYREVEEHYTPKNGWCDAPGCTACERAGAEVAAAKEAALRGFKLNQTSPPKAIGADDQRRIFERGYDKGRDIALQEAQQWAAQSAQRAEAAAKNKWYQKGLHEGREIARRDRVPVQKEFGREAFMGQILQECRVIGESNPQMNPAMNALRHRLKKIP